jgi:hypothetical protein
MSLLALLLLLLLRAAACVALRCVSICPTMLSSLLHAVM